MSRDFREVGRETPFLLPPSLQEWLPEDHLARFVVEVVDSLDVSRLVSAYGHGGQRAYHPRMLLALLFYGYATGVFSSHKLERATRDSVAFRYIAANSHPDHDTIAAFRKRFVGQMQDLFVQILQTARAMGFVRLGGVSLDGTKVQANASKHKALSWAYADRLEAQLKAEVDIPEELRRREDRLEAIRAAKAEMEARAAARHEDEEKAWREKMEARAKREERSGRKSGGKPPSPPQAGPRGKNQVNLTDPESRIMKTADGFEQAYNAQAVVDNASHLIVAAHVSDAVNDKRQVAAALEHLEASADAVGQPEAVLADSGHHSAANLALLEDHGLVPFIAEGREAHNRPLEERPGDPPALPADAGVVARARHRMATPQGKAVYARRKATVETVFGVIKEVMGFRRFHLRGLQAAGGEWTLVSLAWNLKRMHALAAGT
ncbi:MAG: IS1182 family transposase [bacterium]|nr:IS1182 family transposase [bacterium]